ncbi:hypothetical protein MKX01_006194 [Papaver californicum]|nr:hypothetical protein MKX01_006194 [Papaver californicum]
MRPHKTYLSTSKDLYYHNRSKLSFVAVQVGQAFRNEISPCQGLLQVHEFTLAQNEDFVVPEKKIHPKYKRVVDLEFLMFPREEQKTEKDDIKLRHGDAVTNRTMNNETLERLRFRQYLVNEMVHYAADCQDAEIGSSYGWIECVDIADRSAYDLRSHSKKYGTPLVGHEKFSEMGLAFKGNQKKIAMEVKAALQLKGTWISKSALYKMFTIKSSMVSIYREIKKEHQRVFTPSVIEPSFGIGQIVLEKKIFNHSFYTRPSNAGDEVEQLKCTVFPLVQYPEYEAVAEQISESLTAAGISKKIDITGTSINRETICVMCVQDFTNGVRTQADIQSEYPSHSSMSSADKFNRQRRFQSISGVYTSIIIIGIFGTIWI